MSSNPSFVCRTGGVKSTARHSSLAPTTASWCLCTIRSSPFIHVVPALCASPEHTGGAQDNKSLKLLASTGRSFRTPSTFDKCLRGTSTCPFCVMSSLLPSAQPLCLFSRVWCQSRFCTHKVYLGSSHGGQLESKSKPGGPLRRRCRQRRLSHSL